MTFRLLVSFTIFLLSLDLPAQNTFWGEFEFPSELGLWKGDIDDFIIQNEKLRLYAPEGKNTSEIYVPFQFLDKSQWNFTISMDFSPSGSNYTEFILAKDTLTNQKIYCRIGENGSSDAIELFLNNFSIVRMDEGAFSNAFQNEKIEIKYQHGEWIINTDRSHKSVHYPVSLNSFNAFAIQCTYSKTRRDLFYFDSLYVVSEAIPDTSGPKITEVKLNYSGKNSLEFNEPVEKAESFIINKKTPLYFLLKENRIEFQFTGVENKIDIEVKLVDKFGNSSFIDTTFAFPFQNKGGILITELMIDPEPAIFLPNSEYIELFNPTSENIILKKWLISDASQNKSIIPETELKAGEAVILIPEATKSLFSKDIKKVEIENFPSLNNNNDIISIYDSSGILVHQVNYNTSIFENLSDGGKSLELVNSQNACSFTSFTWKESIAFKGGTPGIFTNSESEIIQSTIDGIIKNDTIRIGLSSISSTYRLSNTIIENNELKSFYWFSPDTLELVFKNSIKSGEIVHLNLLYLDCQLQEVNVEKDFLIPEALKTGDVKINEFLINGKESIDFIEFINVSNKPVLSNQIILTQLENGLIERSWKTEKTAIIEPNELWVWTPSQKTLNKNYSVNRPEMCQEVNINLTENIELGLYSSEGIQLDQLNTHIVDTKNWLNSPDNASWERLSTNMLSNSTETWAPSTELSNWATPTGFNTQTRLEGQYQEYEITNRIIRTTSNNPKEQQIEIVFHPENSHTYVNAIIFSRNGQKVKNLVNNRLLASEDRIFWNGTDENNRLLATNIYLLYLEIYNLNGKTKVKKESIVID